MSTEFDKTFRWNAAGGKGAENDIMSLGRQRGMVPSGPLSNIGTLSEHLLSNF